MLYRWRFRISSWRGLCPFILHSLRLPGFEVVQSYPDIILDYLSKSDLRRGSINLIPLGVEQEVPFQLD